MAEGSTPPGFRYADASDAEKAAFDVGYECGENSGHADFMATLIDIVPDDVDGDSPTAVAAYIRVLQTMVERLIAPQWEEGSAVDTPWTFNGVEEVWCFWCNEDPPDHAEDCAWAAARSFIAPDLDSAAANPSSVAEATDG